MTQGTLASPHYDLADALDRVSDGNPIVLTLEGQPVAAVISVKDLRLLKRYVGDLEDRIDREELAEAKAEPSAPMPFEDFCKELGL